MKLAVAVLIAAGCALAQAPVPFGGLGSGGAGAMPCVGTPGNTIGSYLSQCQDTGGLLYTCNAGIGCSTSGDWVKQQGSGSFSYPTGTGFTIVSAGTSWGTTLVDPLAIGHGGTGTASTLTGLVRGNASAMTAAELSGDATTSGSNAVTVVKINGTSLAGLATGILKNTTSTGVPSIALAGDFPTLNQNTTGSAASAVAATNLSGGAVGSIPYQSAAATTLFVSGNTAATDQVVTSTGTGSAAQAPTLKNAPALSPANFTNNWPASMTLTTPSVTTINDANGNAFIKSSATASAVDSVTVTNAATASPATVAVSATGSDSNINLNLVSKGTGVVECNGAPCQLHAISFTVDGGGSAISTGDIKSYPTSDFACTITRIDISADQSGSVTVDVWKANAAVPTSGSKISASAPLTLSSAQLSQAGSLTGWTLGVAVGDVFGFNVATATTVTRVNGTIWCQ